MEILTINPIEIFVEWSLKNSGREPSVIIINPVSYQFLLDKVHEFQRTNKIKTFGGVRLLRSEDVPADKYEIY